MESDSAFPPAPPPSDEARVVFGDRLPQAESFAGLLADAGVRRGLIGPRETGRLWERHLVNCAVVAELLPQGARVVDIGSGAGLPGVALACVRTDLAVDLVDSLQRRTRFLAEVVTELHLGDRVRVHLGRAEDPSTRAAVGNAGWVTARAVAPLDRLVGWSLPLLAPRGWLLALKGASAAEEVRSTAPALVRLGAAATEIVDCGVGIVADPTRVVRVQRR